MDIYTIGTVLFLVTLLLSFLAQSAVTRTFNKYNRMGTIGNLSGAEVADKILQLHDIHNVSITESSGFLTDHYNPLTKTLALSPHVFEGRSIASAGIAAHEVGHAIQHRDGYLFMHVRSAIVPLAKLGSSIAPFLIIAGMVFQIYQALWLAIVVFGVSFVFSVITLPVEFDASARAVAILESGSFLTSDELTGTKEILRAAAMTYVLGALMALAQLLRFIGLSQRRR